MAYLRGVETVPLEPSGESLTEEGSAERRGIALSVLDEFWRASSTQAWGLGRDEFNRIVLEATAAQNFGLSPGAMASTEQRATFLRELRVDELVLAKACAAGDGRAWEQFVAQYGQPLTRAAIAISGSETVGRDLADGFYAELYGLELRDGARRCPLDSYRGRGSLLGWLRTTLAQRFVDHHRRTHREQPLDDFDAPAADGAAEEDAAKSPLLAQAVESALRGVGPEEQFLLAAYYLDDRTLAQIAAVLHVHEATISRRLRRAAESARKEIVRSLMKAGMSRRAVEEALGTDPRDVDLKMDLKKLLQSSEPEAFPEKAAASDEKVPGSGRTISNKAKAAE